MPKDANRAAVLMRESAELGHGDAQARLAAYYRHGFGVDTDLEQARYWAVRAVQQESPRGYYALGLLLKEGSGVKQDPAAGFELIRKAADMGHDEAQMQAGFEYEVGKIVAKDLSNARKYYQLAADRDNGTAMMRLGRLYRYAIGVDRDLAKARYWFEQAHQRDVPHGTYMLADMMYWDQGGGKDVKAAIELWKQNADYWPQSAHDLGVAYHFGSDQVEANPVLAVKY
ncbi:tetratricopeptide repeat protein [Pseudoduganella sp. OTU4001]|uniref:tetratricopeptide repeat protein n=1 Tax=Pseudoduganella sp. OTU4001 TaxID=3043854 RepID=UPI00313AEC49